MKNLNTTGTFTDYIMSIHAEIVRLLNRQPVPEGVRYWVQVRDECKGPGTGAMKSITISDGSAFTSFSFAEKEFINNTLIGRENLAEARFQMAIEDLRDLIEPTDQMIRRLIMDEPKKPAEPEFTLVDAKRKLDRIMIEINDTIGENLLGEFLSNRRQHHVLDSTINLAVTVHIELKEATGHRAKEVVIGRTIRACDQMIKLLEGSKTKLEALR